MSTANWLEVHSDLPDHPKVRFCAGLLRVDPDMLVGKLLRLWTWALNNREDGRFLSCETDLIAEKMRWPKAPGKLVDALCAVAPGETAGFLLHDETGFSIYHWKEYAGKLIEKRARDRARKSAAHSAPIPEKSAGIPTGLYRKEAGNDTEFQRNSDGIPGVTPNPLPLTTKLSDNNSSCGSTGESACAREEPPPRPPLNPDLAAVMQRYEQIYATLPNRIVIEDVKAFLGDGMSAEVVCAAVDELARAAPAKPAAYFRTILNRWHDAGIKDMAALEAYKQREQQQREGVTKPNGWDIKVGTDGVKRDSLGNVVY